MSLCIEDLGFEDISDKVIMLTGASTEEYTAGLRLQLNQLHKDGIHIRVMNILPGATNSEYWGERKVPHNTFMTSEEMASVILQTVATKRTVLVKNYQVEQFRFPN